MALRGRLGWIDYVEHTPFVKAMDKAETHLVEALSHFEAGKIATARNEVDAARDVIGVVVPGILPIEQAPRVAARLEVPVGSLYEAKSAGEILGRAQNYGFRRRATQKDAETAIYHVRIAGHAAIDRLPGAKPVKLSMAGTVMDPA